MGDELMFCVEPRRVARLGHDTPASRDVPGENDCCRGRIVFRRERDDQVVGEKRGGSAGAESWAKERGQSSQLRERRGLARQWTDASKRSCEYLCSCSRNQARGWASRGVPQPASCPPVKRGARNSGGSGAPD